MISRSIVSRPVIADAFAGPHWGLTQLWQDITVWAPVTQLLITASEIELQIIYRRF